MIIKPVGDRVFFWGGGRRVNGEGIEEGGVCRSCMSRLILSIEQLSLKRNEISYNFKHINLFDEIFFDSVGQNYDKLYNIFVIVKYLWSVIRWYKIGHQKIQYWYEGICCTNSLVKSVY